MWPFIFAIPHMYSSQQTPKSVAHIVQFSSENRRRTSPMDLQMIDAVERSQSRLVAALLRNGANVNARKAGETALMIAARNGNRACLLELLKVGADQDVLDTHGRNIKSVIASLHPSLLKDTAFVKALENGNRLARGHDEWWFNLAREKQKNEHAFDKNVLEKASSTKTSADESKVVEYMNAAPMNKLKKKRFLKTLHGYQIVDAKSFRFRENFRIVKLTNRAHYYISGHAHSRKTERKVSAQELDWMLRHGHRYNQDWGRQRIYHPDRNFYLVYAVKSQGVVTVIPCLPDRFERWVKRRDAQEVGPTLSNPSFASQGPTNLELVVSLFGPECIADTHTASIGELGDGL